MNVGVVGNEMQRLIIGCTAARHTIRDKARPVLDELVREWSLTKCGSSAGWTSGFLLLLGTRKDGALIMIKSILLIWQSAATAYAGIQQEVCRKPPRWVLTNSEANNKLFDGAMEAILSDARTTTLLPLNFHVCNHESPKRVQYWLIPSGQVRSLSKYSEQTAYHIL